MKQLTSILEGIFNAGDSDPILWAKRVTNIEIPILTDPVISSTNPLTFDKPGKSKRDTSITLNLGVPGDFNYCLDLNIDELNAITDDSGRIHGYCHSDVETLRIYSNSTTVRDLKWNNIQMLVAGQFLDKFKTIEKFENCQITPAINGGYQTFDLNLIKTKIRSWSDLYGLKLNCKKRTPEMRNDRNVYVNLLINGTPLGQKVGQQIRKMNQLSGEEFYKAEEKFVSQFKEWCPNIKYIKYSSNHPAIQIRMSLNGGLYTVHTNTSDKE